MFCYPRVLGFVFNPLTVFYGFDAENKRLAEVRKATSNIN